MRLSVVVHVIGTLVRLFGPMLLAPALVAAYYREWTDAAGFLVAAASTSLLGQIMRRDRRIQRRARKPSSCGASKAWPSSRAPGC